MRSRVTITVAGPTGSGKTTLAHEIAGMLERAGITAEVEDVDDHIDPQYTAPLKQACRMRTLADAIMVRVETKQVKPSD